MYELPQPDVIVLSGFLPLGPLGQGASAIVGLGKVAMKTFPLTDTLASTPAAAAGQILYVVGFLLGLLMWSFANLWLCLVLISMGVSKLLFNLGWWAIVFSGAVFAGATCRIGLEMPSRFFDVLGTVKCSFLISVVLLRRRDKRDRLTNLRF
jgi:tellurite resistance protein TehA-like permease